MKKLLLITLSLLTAALSTSVLAHPGHLANDSVHGFLHAEHIIVISMIAIVVFVVALFRNK